MPPRPPSSFLSAKPQYYLLMSITSSNTARNAMKLRLVFLGDQGVGKSSIIDRYTTNRFDESHNSTVGIDFNVRDLSRGAQVYRLQMWDTAGQERYRSLIPTYLKNAQCAVFVYDVTRPSTLEDVKMWQRLFREHQEAPGVLVANKTDLSAGRKVSREQGQAAAALLKLRHFEVSAKTGKRVSELFDEILDILLQHMRKEQEFVQSTREQLKDLNTIQEEGVQPRGDGDGNGKGKKDQSGLTLRSRALQLARNLKCCGSSS